MKNLSNIIILTGGIGSGKSVVSRVLRTMGHTVYDCDQEAKRLMLKDEQLRQQLISAFGPETFLADGSLNKPHLATLIFNDQQTLATMDAIVHPAVARDIERVAQKHPTLFVETAIYFESHFDRYIQAEKIWCIASPLELRIHRAMVRDNAPLEKILARINSQMAQEEKIRLSQAVIWNDDTHSIIEQVNELVK